MPMSDDGSCTRARYETLYIIDSRVVSVLGGNKYKVRHHREESLKEAQQSIKTEQTDLVYGLAMELSLQEFSIRGSESCFSQS